ncbi:hypothetical protein DE146DRAFT_629722 [Phaeosphaeria sp. MPI-PUGE-AT-0046c]|nr:hypothetical protein DE146DRAFT_629722 [Phaeosphaeria sp. MPI-PUGE-AT-0046c]
MYMLSSTSLILGLAPRVLASVGVVDINDLLQPDLNANLFVDADRPHAPWSHEPYCHTSRKLSHLGQKYCVFSSNATGPYGLSLIFNPKSGAAASRHLNEIPLSSFLTQSQAEALYLHPAPWKVVSIPGKDKGVIATRRIEKYETFMLDQAAVVLDMDVRAALGQDARRDLLKVAVDRLYIPGTIRAMSAAHARDGEDSMTLEEDIMETNAYGSEVAGVSSRALYPLISRINHACDPNAFVMFSQAGVSMAVKAYRAIEPGEEITVSYLLLGAPSRKRHDLLHRWGFKCTCSLCSLPQLEKKVSDTRRLMISSAEARVVELAGKRELNAAIATALEVVELVNDEGGLESLLTDEYAMLAMLYKSKGDRREADKWGRKAWALLGDLGYLGVESGMEGYELETLVEGIGGLGGKGKGWRGRT